MELRGCGNVIGLHTAAEIQELADALVLASFPIEFAPLLAPLIQGAIHYEVPSREICAACKEVMAMFREELQLMATANKDNGFLSYCGESIEGHKVVFSGLLLDPIECTGFSPIGKVKVRQHDCTFFT